MAMLKDRRYLNNKNKFLEFSYLALQDQFRSKDEFISFFESIENDDQKNLFLKTASFYLFLAKKGDWLVDILSSNKIVDYLTITYKYIAIFSLIELLYNQGFIDFYSYLIKRKSNIKFPIQDKAELEKYYRKYKNEFGSIRQSIRFFKSLSSERQETLIKKLEVKGTKPTIENLSKYLYELRSKFVHEAKLIVNMSGRTTIGRNGKKIVMCKLSIKDLMQFFEEGLVIHFKCQET
jgi:hypothetical protein